MKQNSLKHVEPEVYDLIQGELKRQEVGLELIPSENYASPAVREAMGSILTNKYSEGYPGKRYYGGQEWVDKIENLAKARALALFGVTPGDYHVNVQPYSGSPANIAVYVALAEFGDTLMGMDLTQGGHLTHGHKVNFSGKAYKFSPYGVEKQTHRIDYEAVRSIARQVKPRIIVSGATAYPRTIDFQKFQDIAGEVGAIHMADISHIAGLIAAGAHPSPFPFTDVVTTTTHKTLRGPRGAMIFCKPEYAEKIDRAVFPGLQGGPHEHAIAAKAVAFQEALQPEFKDYGFQVVKNAQALGVALSGKGYALITGGTDNHLLLVDVTKRGVSGKQAQMMLDEVGITVNKNTIPFETRTPFDPSGIRLGTPAITTRGMKEPAMKIVGEAIDRVLSSLVLEEGSRNKILQVVRRDITTLAKEFPLP
jgi:glycine hydroxymethyltransferase